MNQCSNFSKNFVFKNRPKIEKSNPPNKVLISQLSGVSFCSWCYVSSVFLGYFTNTNIQIHHKACILKQHLCSDSCCTYFSTNFLSSIWAGSCLPNRKWDGQPGRPPLYIIHSCEINLALIRDSLDVFQ